jgi:hypothetical protein
MSTNHKSLELNVLSSSNPGQPVRKSFGTLRSMFLTLSVAASLASAAVLTGCGFSATAISPSALSQGSAIQGRIHNGLQEVSGAHVYLLAANTTGYGNASVSLLDAASTGHSDSLGAYVLTDSKGLFNIAGGYTCSPNAQVYLYGTGGDAGSGPNTAAGYLAILGSCNSAQSSSVWMNEVTTIAAAYAFAGYATDATHVSSSGTPLALTGVQNAFATASNLVSLSDGIALATTPAGNGTVPQLTINALANILSACVNSTGAGSAACSTLMSNATSDGTSSGTQPADTATAAINIAHHPAANVATLYGLINGQTFAFAPDTISQPADFSLAVTYTNSGLRIAAQPAIDAKGNVWIADSNGSTGNGGLVELNSLGAAISPAGGWTDPSLSSPVSAAVDTFGNVWVANYTGNSLSKFSSTGSLIATAAAPGAALLYPRYFGFDPSGNAWVGSSDSVTNSLMKFSNSGTYLAAYTGNGIGQSNGLAIDPAGNIWLSQSSGLSEFTASGAPANRSPLPNTGNIQSIALDSSDRLWLLAPNGMVDVLTGLQGSVTGTPFTTGGNGFALAQSIDGAGQDWIVSSPFASATSNLVGVTSAGDLLTSSTGYSFSNQGYNAGGPAIDGSGNIWVTGGNQVTEFIGAATPVVTPVAASLVSPYSAPASRP